MLERHLLEAARYAALALNQPAADTHCLAQVLLLRDDVHIALRETAETVTGLGDERIRLPRMLRLAEHPVEAMIDAFARQPLLGPQDWMKRPAPSERWGNRAVAAPIDVVDVWRRWAAEAVVVRHAAWRAVPRLDDDQRWALLRDVAALIEVAATLDRRWATSWTTCLHPARQLVLSAAAVEVAAREVRSLGSPEAPAADDRPHGVVLISDIDCIVPATRMLTDLLADDSRAVGVSSLISAASVLGQLSLAAADVLEPQKSVAPCLDGASDAAKAMREHGHAMASFVRKARPRIATLHQEPAHVRNQALELAASGLPRLRSCTDHRDGERRTLLPLAAAIADATRALRQRLEDLEHSGQLLVRDGRAMDAHRAWTPAQRTGGIEHLLPRLYEAEAAAKRIPGPGFGHEHRATATAQLEDELTRKRRLDRPARPALATISESLTR